MVRGLDAFATWFHGDDAHFVLIGGVATQLVLEDAGLPARATKDLDIVLCVEALTAAFGEKLWAFVRQAGYEVREQGADPRRFYRFAKPTDASFPHMLEFFARAPGQFPLAAGAHLTPVPIGTEVTSLSAILLDADYYNFLHAHTRRLGGVRVVTEHGLIPLKARAWLDLVARRDVDSQAVNGRQISKHRNDVLRLSQLLSEQDRIDAPAPIAADVGRFLNAVGRELDDELLGSLEIREPAVALQTRLRSAFGAPA
jgi:hypothetical protein